MTVMFEEGALNEQQHLTVVNPKINDYVKMITRGVPLDKRFVYYLLAATESVLFLCQRALTVTFMDFESPCLSPTTTGLSISSEQ